MSNKLTWYIHFFLFILCLNYDAVVAQQLATAEISNNASREHTDHEIIDRLRVIPNYMINHQFNPVVKSYVRTYTVKNRKRTEEMLGKTDLYFPMFERLLSEANLPLELKYLSIVESALNPHARSRSGAVGLWQFMPPTGKEYGLNIRSSYDERKDPEKSTRAAIKYLGKLYDRFGSWELALAAYNGGPGRISRAVRRAGTNDYWQLNKYIPRETRNYVSAYIGASYVANYYYLHDLQPKTIDAKLIDNKSILIKEGILFSDIASRTGLPLEWIKMLNPQYNKASIPARSSGHPLVLPSLEAELIRNAFTAMPRNNLVLDQWRKKADYQQQNYTVASGEKLEDIAKAFNCSAEDIVKWNRLTSAGLYGGKNLIVFSKKETKPVRNWSESPLVSHKRSIRIANKNQRVIEMPDQSAIFVASSRSKNSRIIKDGKIKYYILARGESLSDVARKFSKLTLQELIQLNNININQQLSAGQRLIISK